MSVVRKVGFVSLIIVAVMAAIIFCFRYCENMPVKSKEKEAIIKIDSLNAKADSIIIIRNNIQLRYKTLIKKEYEKINRIDSLPICAVADSIAKYYKPPNR